MSKKTEFAISLKLLADKFKSGLNNVKGLLNKFKSNVSTSFSTKGVTNFTKSVNNMGSTFSSQMKNMKSQMSSTQAKISEFGKAIAGVFAVDRMIDFGKSIIDVGSNFEDQMARVKAVSGATTEEFEMMSKEAERLGATTRYSATEAAQALENLVRNGLSARKATKALSGVLQLAGSQAIDLAQAADIATNTMNGFGKSTEDLGRINDILAATTANSATNVTDLSEALKNVAPIANLLGVSMEEVCAALGTLANVGIKGSMAGNALRGILNRLIKPTKQGQEALDKYGLAISETEIKAKGFTVILEKLAKAQMSLADQKALFGEEYGAAGAALTSNVRGYTKTKTVVENSEGEAERQFNQGQGEFKKALAELSSNWESFLKGIWNKTSGIFVSIVDGIRSLVDELKKTSTAVAIGISAIAIAVGRYYKKVQTEFKQNLAQNQTSFNKDLLASLIVKGEGDPNDPMTKTTSAMQTRINDIKGLITTIEGLYDQMSDADKKSAKEAVDLGNEYIDTLERRIGYINKITGLNTVEEPVRPEEPRHYSELLKGNKVAEWAETAENVARGAADTVNGLNKAFKGTGNSAESSSNKIVRGAGKVKKYAQGVEAGAKAIKTFANGFKKLKEWWKHSGGNKEATGYYTGEDSYKREIEAYNKKMELYQQDLAAYQQYIDEKENLSRELNSQEKKSRRMMEDAMRTSGKSFQELENFDYDEGLQEFLDGVEKAKKERNELLKTGIWKKAGTAIKNFLGSVVSALGGAIGITTSILAFIGKGVYDYFQEQNRVFKELKAEQKKIIDKYSTMETKVMSLIGVMRLYSKETTAWKAAKDQLNSAYPDLFKNLNLEKIYVETNTTEYEKLERRIKSVIAQQKEYMLNEHKRQAIQRLQDDFISKTNSEGVFGFLGLGTSINERLTNIFASGKDKDGKDIQKEAAIILAAQLRDEILSMLTEGNSVTEIEEHIQAMFNKHKVSSNSVSLYKLGGAKGLANTLYNDYERYRKEIESINKLDSGSDVHPEQMIFDIVELALDNFKDQVELKTSEGKAKNQTEEEINSAIEGIREAALNELVDELNGISSKIDNKSALEYAKSLGLFDELLPKTGKKKGGKGGSTTTTETETTITGSGDSKTPKQLFDETKKYIDALKDAGIIKEKEYRERLLSAYETYISGLENEHKTDKNTLDTIRELNKKRDDLKKQIEETEKAEAHWKEVTDIHAKVKEELIENDKDRLEQAKSIDKSMSRAGNRRDKYNPYKWDQVFSGSKFEGSLVSMEHDFQKLEDYLNDLTSISSLEEIEEQLKEIENLKGEGVDALRKQLNLLKEEIIKADEAATSLDDKIQLKRAKKEIADLSNEVGLMWYETGKGLFSTFDGLVNSLEEVHKNWDEMDFGEQMIQGIFGTIDAIISMVEMIKQLQEAWEFLSFKKKALAAVEESETAKKIGLTQAEAAAVVAAEAEKATAYTTAIAAQTAANASAKAIQTKAAMIAMAAESTAAYAAIPFGGVALASAQIAEMEALVAAVAALPAFAEGGIVGGSRYIGDQNLARVNSGEMILNGSQQSRLWDAISNNRLGGNTLSGDVEFKISGQALRGVLKNYDNKMSKIN